MNGSLVAVSNSEIATWDRCRRQWYLKYYLGEVPADEPPVGNAQLGTRVHAALEGHYGHQLDAVAVLDTLYALTIQARPDYKTELLAERETAVAMVTGYLEWVAAGAEDAGLRVVAVEADMQAPLPGVPGVALRARLDQVVLNEDTGLLSFLDWKTSANFDAHDLLALHPQFKAYSVLQHLLTAGKPGAPQVNGGIINTLRRVKRTGNAKPPFYQRDSFRYTDEELDAALLRIQKIAAEIMDARASLDYAYREGGGRLEVVNAVQRYNLAPSPLLQQCRWDCPFLTVCPMMDDGSDWPGVLQHSGRFRQDDPYAYYRADPLRAVQEVLGR